MLLLARRCNERGGGWPRWLPEENGCAWGIASYRGPGRSGLKSLIICFRKLNSDLDFRMIPRPYKAIIQSGGSEPAGRPGPVQPRRQDRQASIAGRIGSKVQERPNLQLTRLRGPKGRILGSPSLRACAWMCSACVGKRRRTREQNNDSSIQHGGLHNMGPVIPSSASRSPTPAGAVHASPAVALTKTPRGRE